MKPDLLHILQHSLGVDQYGCGAQYRNRFVTGPGSDDFEKCRELCEQELMKDYGPQSIADGMHCFCVTDAGKDAVGLHSPSPPRVSRSRQRYLSWLKADCGMKFGEWLKLKHE